MLNFKELDKKYSLTENDDFFFKDTCKRWPELEKYRDSVYVICSFLWYIEGISDDELYFILNKKISENKKIIFSHTPETLLTPAIDKIHNILENYDISGENVFYTVGALDGQESYDEYCELKGYKNKIKAILCCYDFQRVMYDFHREPFETQEYQVKIKPKKFLSFNKVPRYHRLYLLAYLLKSKLFDKGYVSLEGEQVGTDPWITNFIERGFKHFYKDLVPMWVVDEIHKIHKKLPIRLHGGISAERPNPLEINFTDLEYHRNSYFSIVTETLFYDELNETHIPTLITRFKGNYFITEKIYKPIICKHPFILLAPAGTLKALRTQGYKTFHPFFDESYDEVTNDEERINLIFNEINRLCSLSDTEWLELQSNIKPIVEYNAELFHKIDKFNYTEFNEEWFNND